MTAAGAPLQWRVGSGSVLLAIYFMHYNYVRIHTTPRVTPAMAAGASTTLWTMDDVVKVVEDWEASCEAST